MFEKVGKKDGGKNDRHRRYAIYFQLAEEHLSSSLCCLSAQMNIFFRYHPPSSIDLFVLNRRANEIF